MTMSPRWMVMALLCWGTPALAEDLVVIDASNAPGFPEGTVIADGKSVELPAGAKVILIGASGKTVPLTGPYKGVPSSGTGKADSRMVIALTSLVQPRQAETNIVGAVRAINWRTASVKSAGDVYVLDGSLSEQQCLTAANLKQASFVFDPERKKPSDALTLLSAESGSAETLSPFGKSGIAWPKNIPLEDGYTYLVEVPGQSTVFQFGLKVIAKPAENDVQRAMQLLEAGCTVQAKLMIEVVKKAAQ